MRFLWILLYYMSGCSKVACSRQIFFSRCETIITKTFLFLYLFIYCLYISVNKYSKVVLFTLYNLTKGGNKLPYASWQDISCLSNRLKSLLLLDILLNEHRIVYGTSTLKYISSLTML